MGKTVLVVCLVFALCPAWRHVGLSGHRVWSVANPSRDRCYAATDSAVFVTSNRGGWWNEVYDYGVHENLRVCVRAPMGHEGKVYLAWGWGSRSDGLWYSPDCGDSWHVMKYLLYPSVVEASQEDTSFILLASDTLENGLWRSTDRGHTWARSDSGLATTNIRCLATGGSLVWCGTKGHGLYLSTDYGTSWRFAGPDSQMDVRGICWCYYDSRVVMIGEGVGSSGIWCTNDLGATWNRELALDSGRCIGGHYAGAQQHPGMFHYWEGEWRPDTTVPDRVYSLSDHYQAFWYAGTEDGVYHYDETPGVGELPSSVVLSANRLWQVRFHSVLLDITGRWVMNLVPGENDVSRVAPGVYFVFRASGVRREASSVHKVVIQR